MHLQQHPMVFNFGTYPGSPQGSILIFTAHYDSTTHLGDQKKRQDISPPHNRPCSASCCITIRVINLEAIGASDILAYSPEDGFATRRYRSSEAIINFVNNVANTHIGRPLKEVSLLFGTLKDGRSFLARDIEAITLRSYTGDEFPRRLHSKHDSRDRLLDTGIKKGTEFLGALVQQADSQTDHHEKTVH